MLIRILGLSSLLVAGSLSLAYGSAIPDGESEKKEEEKNTESLGLRTNAHVIGGIDDAMEKLRAFVQTISQYPNLGLTGIGARLVEMATQEQPKLEELSALAHQANLIISGIRQSDSYRGTLREALVHVSYAVLNSFKVINFYVFPDNTDEALGSELENLDHQAERTLFDCNSPDVVDGPESKISGELDSDPSPTSAVSGGSEAKGSLQNTTNVDRFPISSQLQPASFERRRYNRDGLSREQRKNDVFCGSNYDRRYH